jgi:WD40 repeat protein
LASGSYDTNIIIWDFLQATQVYVLKGHNQSIYSIAYSLDGK